MLEGQKQNDSLPSAPLQTLPWAVRMLLWRNSLVTPLNPGSSYYLLNTQLKVHVDLVHIIFPQT